VGASIVDSDDLDVLVTTSAVGAFVFNAQVREPHGVTNHWQIVLGRPSFDAVTVASRHATRVPLSSIRLLKEALIFGL
jgi:hypothetical protein